MNVHDYVNVHEVISTDIHIALYADDTKIWRSIKNEEDIAQLQRDINILYFWSLNNKMKFHPDKCKVLTIKHKPSPLTMLPFVADHYHLGENLLSYADSEKDLGVHINKSFTFVKLGFEIAVDQQTRTGDRTFEGVPDPNRQTVPEGQPRPYLVQIRPNVAKYPEHAQNHALGCSTCSY